MHLITYCAYYAYFIVSSTILKTWNVERTSTPSMRRNQGSRPGGGGSGSSWDAVTLKKVRKNGFSVQNWQRQIQTYAVFFIVTASQIVLIFFLWPIQIFPHLDKITGRNHLSGPPISGCAWTCVPEVGSGRAFHFRLVGEPFKSLYWH